ncbi:MAG: helix-turn-helix transcriptional regulator [Desulfobulbaceae bacterium]|nr:helix-turn-helix transcriptional regulator [Desulfobulbaceae bacterium]
MPLQIISAREGRKLSLNQLAERTDSTKSILRKIELGIICPTIATIRKIANGPIQSGAIF